MAILSEDMKEAIVKRLARFQTPTEVAEAVGEEFFGNKKAIDRSQVAQYNVGTASYEGAQRFVYLFDAERMAYRKELEEHAISDAGYRLGMLQRIAERAYSQGNMVQAMAALEMAQKELGAGAYSRDRNVAHSGSIDINAARRPSTPAEARIELMQRMEQLRLANPSAPASEQIIEG